MDRQLTALVVDDEEKAVSLLNKLLEDTRQFSEIRSANSAVSASRKLSHFQPDIIFLDIQMPEEDGLAFIRRMKDERINSAVIFITAYEQYALEAIRNHAFGYLLKPVGRGELNDCIEDFRTTRKQVDHFVRLEKLLEEFENKKEKLCFNTRTGTVYIDPADVLYCQADGNYTLINVGKMQHLFSVQIGLVREMLPNTGFVRLGRSLIINFKYISKVDRKTSELIFEKDACLFPLKVAKAQLKELERCRTV